jgi:bifunctional UDP-N-acetylglucosamine pyrophosphorylase/glucosamine-1-phosphate N-acetyltransferase
LHYPWEVLHFLEVMSRSVELKDHISNSAQIGLNVVIDGNVFIGDKAVIGDNTVIHGPCYIGAGCRIGASNVLRGPVNLEDEVVTSSFTELKNCCIQQGTHVHSGYFGDSVIGRNCRFGAGFVTANRRIDRGKIKSVVKGEEIDTGLTYLGMVVGDETKFGIGCGTMPGILVGSNCIIGPGTLVFENLEDGTSLFTESKTTKKKNG